MSTLSHPICFSRKPHWLRKAWWDVSNKISDFLTDRGIYFHWKLRDAIYYVKSRFKQYHMIDTKLSKGHWIDKVSLMEAGLLELVDDFVSRDGEDAFSVVYWDEDDGHAEVKAKIIEILYWKHVRFPALEKEKDDLWNVYHKKYPIIFKEISEEECKERGIPEGCKEMTHEGIEDEVDENYRKGDFYVINLKEKFIASETQRILHLCVDVREYLWT
jgi:hypothetical protein